MDYYTILYIVTPLVYAFIFVVFYKVTEFVTRYLLVEHRERLWIIHVCVLFGSVAFAWLIHNLCPHANGHAFMIKIFLMIYIPSFLGIWVGSHGAKKALKE